MLMTAKPILHQSEVLMQDEDPMGKSDTGLRILAHLIARDIIRRRSEQSKENKTKTNDSSSAETQ